MERSYHKTLIVFLIFVYASCSTPSESNEESRRKQNQTGEYIYRTNNEYRFTVEPPLPKPKEPYPWEVGQNLKHHRITKDFFRCKGSTLNPSKVVQKKGEEPIRYHDCGGAEKHSLPLRENKEFIYPVLIDLLNYLQIRTEKRVVITSGHRCPDHNTYVDPSKENQFSKHMIGAEVSFYVQGLELQPETIIKYILEYYHETPKYKGLKDYQEFQRWEKSNVQVTTPPWYNKEIFVKLHKKSEGRDFDNRHPYPYISIQVRYDWDSQEKVTYSWDKAQRNFMRW